MIKQKYKNGTRIIVNENCVIDFIIGERGVISDMRDDGLYRILLNNRDFYLYDTSFDLDIAEIIKENFSLL